MSNPTEAPKGPYEATSITTFEIAGPIKITIKHEDKASHPPTPCNCHGGGNSILQQVMSMVSALGAPVPGVTADAESHTD